MTNISQDVGKNRGSVTGAQYEGAHNSDINYISLNVGDKTPGEITDLIRSLPEISEVIFGKRGGLDRWDGVVREIRKLEEQLQKLSDHMISLQQRMTSMEHKLGQAKQSDGIAVWLSRILIGAGTIAILAQAWQIFSQ